MISYHLRQILDRYSNIGKTLKQSLDRNKEAIGFLLTPVGDHIEVYMGPFAPGSVPTEVFDLRGVLRAFETICWILQAWIVSPHMGQSYSVN